MSSGIRLRRAPSRLLRVLLRSTLTSRDRRELCPPRPPAESLDKAGVQLGMLGKCREVFLLACELILEQATR
jgi:hypothetical protein